MIEFLVPFFIPFSFVFLSFALRMFFASITVQLHNLYLQYHENIKFCIYFRLSVGS